MPRAHSKALPWPKVASAIWIAALWVGAFFCPDAAFSQSKLQQFRQLPRPVRSWVVGHLWVAARAQRLTGLALKELTFAAEGDRLDREFAGGKLDAFRHGYWMALLAQHMRPAKARSLGRAYERANYNQWKRGQLEDNTTQDSISSVMDLRNNEVGIRIGRNNRELTETELARLVTDSVVAGAFWIIAKDVEGHYLDQHGHPIPDTEWKGRWVNLRSLRRSDFSTRN